MEYTAFVGKRVTILTHKLKKNELIFCRLDATQFDEHIIHLIYAFTMCVCVCVFGACGKGHSAAFATIYMMFRAYITVQCIQPCLRWKDCSVLLNIDAPADKCVPGLFYMISINFNPTPHALCTNTHKYILRSLHVVVIFVVVVVYFFPLCMHEPYKLLLSVY